MIGRSLARVMRMDLPEIFWRGRAAARIGFDRARSTVLPAQWARRDLARVLAPLPEFAGLRATLARGGWADAHRALAQHVAAAPQRFVIAPHSRSAVSNRILSAFPDSRENATAMADRILAGDYDLLGYRALRFDGGADPGAAAPIDWGYDPIHQRRPPKRFW